VKLYKNFNSDKYWPNIYSCVLCPRNSYYHITLVWSNSCSWDY